MRALAACIAAALFAPPLAAQTVERRDPRLAEHLMAVSAERLELFLSLYDAAPPDARAAAELALAPGRGPALAWPTRAALARAARAARGFAAPNHAQQDAAARRLAEFVDGLDLLVHPGVFDADQARILAEAGTPLSIAVRVWSPDGAPIPAGPLEIALQLVGTDGEVREVRRIAVDEQAFGGAGFDLYLRAPEGLPGRWWLVPEIRSGERFELGAAVPFDGVASDATEGAALTQEGSCAARRASAQWQQRLELGLRAPEDLDGAALLAQLGAKNATLAARRFEPQFASANGADCAPIAWRYLPREFAPPPPAAASETGVRGVLAVLAPDAESPAALTRGARGEAWMDLADALGFEVWSVSTGGDGLQARLESLAEGCLARGLELVPVARANTSFSLHLALAQSGPEGALTSAVARAALRMPGLSTVPPLGPGVRALVVAPGVEEDLVGLARGFATLPAQPVVVLDDLLWPERLRRWIPRGDAPRRKP
ncbi:MAG: hypothetical protein GC161_02275 [Planctomycetaceae bacterium]|nr:hypothetical protein [Planctomycetaceae bacterium]